MILRAQQPVGATTPGSPPSRVRGADPVPVGYPKKRKPMRLMGACTRCGCRKAQDQKGEMCTPCQRGPRCPVCEGAGRTGRSKQHLCYRCGGSGVQPILSPQVERRRAA